MNVHLYVAPWTIVGVYICYRPVIHMRLLIFLPHIHMLHLPEGLCLAFAQYYLTSPILIQQPTHFLFCRDETRVFNICFIGLYILCIWLGG